MDSNKPQKVARSISKEDKSNPLDKIELSSQEIAGVLTIDRLSSQALILISKYDVWREVNIQGTTTTSGFTMGDWAPQVTRFLTTKMGGANLHTCGRINHSFHELESTGMLVLTGHQLKLTAIGLEIHRILE